MDYRDMGRKIRTLRKAQGFTQEHLAEQLGISASFLGHIERGTRTVSLDTLAALCRTLQVSPAYLMESALGRANLSIPKGLTVTETRKLNDFIDFYCKQMRK